MLDFEVNVCFFKTRQRFQASSRSSWWRFPNAFFFLSKWMTYVLHSAARTEIKKMMTYQNSRTIQVLEYQSMIPVVKARVNYAPKTFWYSFFPTFLEFIVFTSQKVSKKEIIWGWVFMLLTEFELFLFLVRGSFYCIILAELKLNKKHWIKKLYNS